MAVLLATIALVLSAFPATTLAAPSTSQSWIVTLRPGLDAGSAAQELARQHGGSIGFVYRHAINGFSFRGSAAAATALARSPMVSLVEADAEVWLDTTQSNATWGLDRIDQRALPLDMRFAYGPTGAGVTAYVIDSGIRYSHTEFGGRAKFGEDVVGGIEPEGSDCNGHGTHVAGTIGGTTYGVAKGITLVSVRVFGCTGGSSWSTIIAGIDWAAGHHGTGPAVANLSLGGGANSSVDSAVRGLIADGVATAVAAGNGDWLGRQANACNYSPARVAEAMTISATDKTDKKASWANYGSCVDWFAPGVSILSAGITNDTDPATKSGTSMATPHTAGVAALYLDLNETATPQEVRDELYGYTTKGVVTSSSTSNNHLLYSGAIGPVDDSGDGGGDIDTTPPTVSVTGPAAGSTISGTVSVTAEAADVGGIKDVEFFVDGVSIAKDASGSDGWSASWNTTSYSNASHALTARATDIANNSTTSNPVSVTVSNTTSAGSMSTALTSTTSSSGPNWTATISVTVRDAGNNAVSGATVAWTWSDGATGSGSCITGSTGACSDSRTQHKRVGSLTFTVDRVTHTSLAWTGSAKSLTVLKP